MSQVGGAAVADEEIHSGGVKATEYRTKIDHPDCREDLLVALRWLWQREGRPDSIVCIGTDRASGDALGPLIGTELMAWNRLPCAVYGTLDHPLHASNLVALLEKVPKLKNARTLAIDASLGQASEVGTVAVGVGALRPGAGVQKKLPEIGRYYVTGTVNIGGFMDYYVLQNTRLALVMRMAQLIAESIKLSLGF